NEGLANWQSLWTCAAYMLLAVKLWQARAWHQCEFELQLVAGRGSSGRGRVNDVRPRLMPRSGCARVAIAPVGLLASRRTRSGCGPSDEDRSGKNVTATPALASRV